MRSGDFSPLFYFIQVTKQQFIEFIEHLRTEFYSK